MAAPAVRGRGAARWQRTGFRRLHSGQPKTACEIESWHGEPFVGVVVVPTGSAVGLALDLRYAALWRRFAPRADLLDPDGSPVPRRRGQREFGWFSSTVRG